jgi:hypothetical protein
VQRELRELRQVADQTDDGLVAALGDEALAPDGADGVDDTLDVDSLAVDRMTTTMEASSLVTSLLRRRRPRDRPRGLVCCGALSVRLELHDPEGGHSRPRTRRSESVRMLHGR